MMQMSFAESDDTLSR